MANTILRRLTQIKTKEISLVDHAANEREFVVVKRNDQEEIGMSKVVDPKVVQAAKNAEAAAKPTEADGLTALTKQVEELTALLQPDTTPPATETPEAEVEKGASDETTETPAENAPAKDPIEVLSESIHKLTEIVKSVVAKTAETPAEETPAVVEKAILNPARLGRVRKAFAEMLELVKDIDPDGVTALLKGETPAEPVIAPVVEATVVAPVTKSVDGPTIEAVIAKAFEPMAAQLKAMETRLGDIETATTVSKSVGGDSNDAPVLKEVSLWGNVL